MKKIIVNEWKWKKMKKFEMKFWKMKDFWKNLEKWKNERFLKDFWKMKDFQRISKKIWNERIFEDFEWIWKKIWNERILKNFNKFRKMIEILNERNFINLIWKNLERILMKEFKLKKWNWNEN
jgi:hypothetical protein